MKPTPFLVSSARFRAAAALLALLVATGEARAEKKVVAEITTNATFRLYRKSGSFSTYDTSINTNLFDGMLDTGLSIVGNEDQRYQYFIADFSSFVTVDEPKVYVDRIEIGHLEERTYSIYVATDNVSTNAEDWTAVAETVQDSGMKTYDIKGRILAVKYVFETTTGNNDLTEFHVWGYRSSVPKIVSNASLAKMYWSDGTMTKNNGKDGFGGGTGIGNLFNNNFNDNVYIGVTGSDGIPRLENGGYCQLDFSSDVTNGWFVTEIMTGSKTTHQYSLYYSMDGTTWFPVEDGTNVCSIGKRRFNVYDTAVYVKCVFDQIGEWTPAFNELQVWGMNPDDVACEHPSYTEWVMDDSLTDCLLFPVDKRHCAVCGAVFTREEFWALPPGHKYVVALERPGAYKGFGRGHIACARCSFFLDCPAPVNLITNRVGGTQIGDIKADGFVRFTDVSVTSTGNTDWGVRPGHLIDIDWTWGWNHYWYSENDADHPDPDPHVDYEFGTEIDLVWIDISLPNRTHVARFYSVDDNTGEETQLRGFPIKRTDFATGDKYHIWHEPGSEEWEDIYGVYDKDEFDELSVVKDSGIPGRKHDEDGNEISGDNGNNDYNNYQRFTVHFYETPVRHLRIRQFENDGSTMVPMSISELHPWGTVKDAGDLRYRKQTIMILR